MGNSPDGRGRGPGVKVGAMNTHVSKEAQRIAQAEKDGIDTVTGFHVQQALNRQRTALLHPDRKGRRPAVAHRHGGK